MILASPMAYIHSKILSSDLHLLPVHMVRSTTPFGALIRCPDDPDFHWGNFGMVSSDNSLSLDSILECYRAFMADEVRHLALIWDCGIEPNAKVYQCWQRGGVEFDISNGFLLHDQSTLDARQIDGEIRAIVNHADWQKVLELQIEMLGSDVSSNDISVIKRRLVYLQSLCMQDHGKWFGVFKSGKLVADLGIFLCGDVARFQHVETHENYRGQGFCRALIRAAVNWVMMQASPYQIWIESEENSDAAMIYQHLGFQQQERLLAAFHADISQF